MGLDMFLYRKSWVNNSEWVKPEFRTEIKMIRGGEEVNTSNIRYIIEEVGYWRKANQIHKWFVDNVQKGVDDCGEYPVSYEELEELKKVCENILQGLALAEVELPTQSGFFFGSVEYDEYYTQDLKSTIKIIENLFKEPKGQLTYYSSW